MIKDEDIDKAIQDYLDNKLPYVSLWSSDIIISKLTFDNDGYVQVT